MDQQHHAPAPTPCDAHSERVERIRRRRERRRAFRAAARSRRAAAVARAEPGAHFSGAGTDRVAISAAARERPLLFLGCTKREWLSGARGGIVPARPGLVDRVLADPATQSPLADRGSLADRSLPLKAP